MNSSNLAASLEADWVPFNGYGGGMNSTAPAAARAAQREKFRASSAVRESCSPERRGHPSPFVSGLVCGLARLPRGCRGFRGSAPAVGTLQGRVPQRVRCAGSCRRGLFPLRRRQPGVGNGAVGVAHGVVGFEFDGSGRFLDAPFGFWCRRDGVGMRASAPMVGVVGSPPVLVPLGVHNRGRRRRVGAVRALAVP